MVAGTDCVVVVLLSCCCLSLCVCVFCSLSLRPALYTGPLHCPLHCLTLPGGMDRSSASALAKEAIDRGDSHFSLLKEVSALSGGDRLSTEDDDDEQQHQDQQNQEQPEQHERKEGNGSEQSKQRLWAQVFEECTTLENACRRMFHQHLRAVSEKQHRIAKLLSNKMSAFHAQLKAQDKNINYLVDVRRVRVVLFEHTSRTLEVLEARHIGSLTFYVSPCFFMFLHVSPLSLSLCVCFRYRKCTWPFCWKLPEEEDRPLI